MDATHELFFACAPGVEPLLLAELSALEPETAAAEPGGVTVIGDARLLHRAHLEVGLALRAQLLVGRFPARHLHELARRAAEVPWERVLPAGARVEVRAHARRSRLYHTGAIAERVTAGISDRIGAPDDDARRPHDVLARIVEDHCVLSIDTGGDALHRRGYRLATGKAPLREDLARALLIVSGWDRATPLVDPFCGSGTLAIEGALLARRIAPGARRRFAFMDGPLFDAALWDALVAAADAATLPSAPPILASDRDAGAVELARGNAERAGVAADVTFTCAALGHAPGLRRAPSPPGAVVTNPPWGRRVGGRSPVRPLYQSLGTRLRELPGRWRIGLVVADPALARDVAPGLSSALMTDAGGTKIHLFTGATGR